MAQSQSSTPWPQSVSPRESAEIHRLRNAPDAPDNPGIPFDPEPVAGVRVNLSAVERRAATLPKRRTVKKEWQAAWLVKAIQCIDLTTLNSDDTEGRVRAALRQGDASAPSPTCRRRSASPTAASRPARSASITASSPPPSMR